MFSELVKKSIVDQDPDQNRTGPEAEASAIIRIRMSSNALSNYYRSVNVYSEVPA